MSFCPHLLNTTIPSTNTTWSSLDLHALDGFSTYSYLRPDTGVSLLPWIYTIVIILIHLPVVVVRVVRFELVQWWSVLSALLTFVVYLQAYVSTKGVAGQVLVWTPVLLVIDAGAMLQVFFLVVERWHEEGRGLESVPLLRRVRRGRGSSTARPMQGHSTAGLYTSPSSGAYDAPQSDDLRTISQPSTSPLPLSKEARSRRNSNIAALLSSAALFLAILALQIYGLVKAVAGARGPPPTASWCSPMFQPFGIVTADADCGVYSIFQSNQRGIGCISVPGTWQSQWLLISIALTSLGLLLEVVDFCILALVNGTKKFRGVKLQRPWGTMIFGLIVLLLTLIFGVQYATQLPPGVAKSVIVVVELDGLKGFAGTLTTAGLRGAVIGWSDGLFSSWGSTYVGG